MNTLDHLAELLAKATPLPWTAEFLGGRELGDGGMMAELESVSSPFCRATHEDDEAFAVAVINAHPVLAEIVRAAKMLDDNLCAVGGCCHYMSADAERLHDALAKLPKETT